MGRALVDAPGEGGTRGVQQPRGAPEPTGMTLRRWVAFHGIAINVEPDLGHFDGIVPCGIADPRYGVTSLADLGRAVGMTGIDAALRREFEPLFGPTQAAAQLVGSTENSSPA